MLTVSRFFSPEITIERHDLFYAVVRFAFAVYHLSLDSNQETLSAVSSFVRSHLFLLLLLLWSEERGVVSGEQVNDGNARGTEMENCWKTIPTAYIHLQSSQSHLEAQRHKT